MEAARACAPGFPAAYSLPRAQTKVASLVFDKLDLRRCVILGHRASQTRESYLLVHRLASCLRKCLGSSHFGPLFCDEYSRVGDGVAYPHDARRVSGSSGHYKHESSTSPDGRRRLRDRLAGCSRGPQRWPTRLPKSCASIDRPALAHLSHSTTALQPQTRAVLPRKPAIKAVLSVQQC